MPHRDEQADPSLPAPDEAQKEISYLASRLTWAEQQAAAYQRDYEEMLTAKNDLHRELSQAQGSLRAFREENAALKQRSTPGAAPLTRRARALARKLGRKRAAPTTATPSTASSTQAAASNSEQHSAQHPDPAQAGAAAAPFADGYPVPPRKIGRAHV